MLQGKKIAVGVSGSIAAYKSAILIRLLVQEGAEVKVIMTESASWFISPLTLSTLSKNQVVESLSTGGNWNDHVGLGLWADLLLIAPATANTIAKMAQGICDNMLLATYLSSKCPVWIAPAMDLDMWSHAATQRNVALLENDSVVVLEPNSGELASGLIGQGRMKEPEEILDSLKLYFHSSNDLVGTTAVVTAGPSYEAIDPVRFIGNRSSGKMGVAIAEELANRGAMVKLVLGPSQVNTNHPNIVTIQVESAQQMMEAVEKYQDESDVFVMSAAVADFKPESQANRKIKKSSDTIDLRLVKTPDIASRVGTSKKQGQILIGFALETDNELENARTKRVKKNMDLIVLNSLKNKGSGFGYDTNQVTLISETTETELPLMPKKEVAKWIVNWLIEKKKTL